MRDAAAVLVLLCTALLSACGGAAATGTGATAAVAGEWQVTWLENMTVNPLTLGVNGLRVAGHYISDDGEVCAVRGEGSHDGSKLRITVTCPNWDIIMDATARGDGTMEGQYLAYGDSRGRFVMARE